VELNLVTVIEINGEKYYALKSDIGIGTYFPATLLDIMLKNYANAVYSEDVVLGQLGILREFYIEEVRPKEALVT
jgi:hypothetical protein